MMVFPDRMVAVNEGSVSCASPCRVSDIPIKSKDFRARRMSISAKDYDLCKGRCWSRTCERQIFQRSVALKPSTVDGQDALLVVEVPISEQVVHGKHQFGCVDKVGLDATG